MQFVAPCIGTDASFSAAWIVNTSRQATAGSHWFVVLASSVAAHLPPVAGASSSSVVSASPDPLEPNIGQPAAAAAGQSELSADPQPCPQLNSLLLDPATVPFRAYSVAWLTRRRRRSTPRSCLPRLALQYVPSRLRRQLALPNSWLMWLHTTHNRCRTSILL